MTTLAIILLDLFAHKLGSEKRVTLWCYKNETYVEARLDEFESCHNANFVFSDDKVGIMTTLGF